MASTPRKTTNNKDNQQQRQTDTGNLRNNRKNLRRYETRNPFPAFTTWPPDEERQPTNNNKRILGTYETAFDFPFRSVQRNETRNKPVLGLHSYETRTYQAQNTATAQNVNLYGYSYTAIATILRYGHSVPFLPWRHSVPFRPWRKEIESQFQN